MKSVRGFVCLAVLAMGSVWANAAQEYSVRLNNPATVAGTDLKAGDYKVELVGDKAMIHGKKDTVEASVKVEEGSEKFNSTTVRYTVAAGGKYQISEIHLGGTKTKVVFNN